MGAVQRRHARKAHSIGNDEMELAIAQALCRNRAQIGRTRVQMSADHCRATAIDSMAGRAVSQKQLMPLLQGRSVTCKRIPRTPLVPGNGKISHTAGHGCLQRSGRFARAKPAPDHQQEHDSGESGGPNGRPDNSPPPVHPNGHPFNLFRSSMSASTCGRERTGGRMQQFPKSAVYQPCIGSDLASRASAISTKRRDVSGPAPTTISYSANSEIAW